MTIMCWRQTTSNVPITIGETWPILGVWGGQQIPEFEGGEPREAWKRDFWTLRLVRDIWSNNYDRFAAPMEPAFAFGAQWR